MSIFVKDPGARAEHAVDWDAGFLAGRTITASSWSVLPAGGGASLQLEAPRIAGGKTAILLAGGMVGQLYRITNRVTLSDSSIEERTLMVRVEDR
jgi:hypothetical protein